MEIKEKQSEGEEGKTWGRGLEIRLWRAVVGTNSIGTWGPCCSHWFKLLKISLFMGSSWCVQCATWGIKFEAIIIRIPGKLNQLVTFLLCGNEAGITKECKTVQKDELIWRKKQWAVLISILFRNKMLQDTFTAIKPFLINTKVLFPPDIWTIYVHWWTSSFLGWDNFLPSH